MINNLNLLQPYLTHLASVGTTPWSCLLHSTLDERSRSSTPSCTFIIYQLIRWYMQLVLVSSLYFQVQSNVEGDRMIQILFLLNRNVAFVVGFWALECDVLVEAPHCVFLFIICCIWIFQVGEKMVNGKWNVGMWQDWVFWISQNPAFGICFNYVGVKFKWCLVLLR